MMSATLAELGHTGDRQLLDDPECGWRRMIGSARWAPEQQVEIAVPVHVRHGGSLGAEPSDTPPSAALAPVDVLLVRALPAETL